MGDVISLPVPRRRWLFAGAAGLVVALLVAAWLGGRYTAPTKTVTVERTVRDESAITEAVERARAEWSKSVQDHTTIRTRTVYSECGQPVETERVVYVDRDSHEGGSMDASSATTAQVVTHAATETTKTVSAASLPGWSLGASALWTPAALSARPTRATVELDRRLFGTLWVGAQAQADISTTADVRLGIAARVEW